MDADDVLILRAGEAEGLLTPAEALEAVEEVWRGQATSAVRLALAAGETRFGVEGAVLDGVVGFTLAARPGDGSASDWIWLLDAAGGQPLALIEAGWLRDLRAASAAALAARLLVAPGARLAAVIGLAGIAGHLPPALAVALPEIADIQLMPPDQAEAGEADLVIIDAAAALPQLRRGATVIALGDGLPRWDGADRVFDQDSAPAQLVGGRSHAGEGILAVLRGQAAEDLALASLAWRRARLRRVGLRIGLGGATEPRAKAPTPRRNRSLLR